EEKDKYVLQRFDAKAPLTDDARALYGKLFAGRDALVLEDANHLTINLAKRAHMRVLRAFGFRRYFLINGLYLLPSLVGCLVLFVWMLSLGAIQPMAFVLFGLALVLHGLFA